MESSALLVLALDMNVAAAVGVLQNRENTNLNLVVVGKAGQGKSTLVNNLLGYKEGEKGAADVGGDGLTTTKEVKCHSKERDGAVVNIWDTPGLADSTSQAVLSKLSVCTQEKADLYSAHMHRLCSRH